MARSSFSLVHDVDSHFEILNSDNLDVEFNWNKCFICQKESDERIICPSNSSHTINLKETYERVLNDIKRFRHFNLLSQPLQHELHVLNIEEKCVENKAGFHKRCRNLYDNQHYDRVVKKIRLSEETILSSEIPSLTKTRSHFDAENFQKLCFFCNEERKENVCQVLTLKLDKRAKLLDEKLIARLSEGDLVATETCYHKTCLAALYNRVRVLNGKQTSKEKGDEILEGMVLAEVVAYIEQCADKKDPVIPVFQLKTLKGD